jgi:hypothetical protein
MIAIEAYQTVILGLATAAVPDLWLQESSTVLLQGIKEISKADAVTNPLQAFSNG